MPSARTLSARDRRRLDEVRAELKTVHLASGPFRADFTADAQDLLGTEVVVATGIRQSPVTRFELPFFRVEGRRGPWRSLAEAFVQHAPRRWGHYDPERPEPRERNAARVWSGSELRATSNAAISQLYPRWGVDGLAHMRVLICDGPSLLAWIGTWQDGAYDARQRSLFKSLIPDLHRRLTVERQLEQGGRTSLLEATLEAIGRPAFVVSSSGAVRETNTAGHELITREGRALREELCVAVKATVEHPRWSVTSVRSSSSTSEHLVLSRAGASDRASAKVTRAAAVFGLTLRQRDVLAKLVEGSANQTIAAMLGISERTVEVHVTALFDKARVGSRAALVAKVFGMD